jgi:hypothetical protein
LTIKLTLDTNLLIALLTFLLALHAVYWLHGVIATCVAHQYSIVKDQRLPFRSQEQKPFGFRLMRFEQREFRIIESRIQNAKHPPFWILNSFEF